jgi:PD-(D/E)XK nuclease superfamily
MAVITNEVSWSRKRASLLGGCLRRYFYQYYLKWDGWNPEAPAERRLAYRLSVMTALPRLAGIAAHETIRRLLWSAKNRRRLTRPAEEIAAAMMRQTWLDAKARRWEERPKQCPPVFELYYQDGVPREEIIRFGQIARKAVKAFESSDLFARISATDPSTWLAVDEPIRFGDAPTCLVDDARVWCRPDFALQQGDRVTIYDWKTGAPKEEDRLQLLAYALHAVDQWRFPPDKIDCVAVYLSDPIAEVPFEVDAAGLEEMLALIRADLARMRELDARSHDPEQFAIDPKPQVCAWCEFQEVCPAVLRKPMHAVPGVSSTESSA